MGASSDKQHEVTGSIELGIVDWSIWPEQRMLANGHANSEIREAGDHYDLGYVDAMARRRLSRLSRMALHVAGRVTIPEIEPGLIFASRHGELERTESILRGLARDEPPLPAAFSLSVHNTVPGVYSIATADHAPATALAAGEETLLWALLEAAGRLNASPSAPILLVYADEVLPDVYHAPEEKPVPAHALALLLRPGNDLRLRWEAPEAGQVRTGCLSLELLFCLGTRRPLVWHGERLTVHGEVHA